MKKYVIKANEQKKIRIPKAGEYLIELVGTGASVEIVGAFMSDGDDRSEVVLTIHHKAPHTRAETTLKAVGAGSSYTKLVGRIVIDENCGDTQSFLTERVLLLSEKARAEAIPDLEISSDDVSCSHAASVTHIPEEHLFYLQSRGVSRLQAEQMVIEGYLTV